MLDAMAMVRPVIAFLAAFEGLPPALGRDAFFAGDVEGWLSCLASPWKDSVRRGELA